MTKKREIFHAQTVQRTMSNRIHGLEDKNGIWQNEPCNLQHVAISYFEELFTFDMVRSEGEVIQIVEQKVGDSENAELIHSFSDEEI